MASCEHNCTQCPFALKVQDGGRMIIVDVVGSAPGISLPVFYASPIRTVAHRGYSICFHDLTGEDFHIGRRIIHDSPDLVLDFADSLDLESTLNLPARLIDMDCPAILALGRYDELAATGHSVDYRTFSRMTGLPVFPVEGGKEESFSRLLSLIVDTFEKPKESRRHIHIPYGTDIEESISRISSVLAESEALTQRFHDRYIALRLMEDPQYILPDIKDDPAVVKATSVAVKEAVGLESEFGKPVEELILKARQGFVKGALQETLRHSSDNSDHTTAQKIDALLTNRWLGFPLLILILLGVFGATFALGAYPERWIEGGISLLGTKLLALMGRGWLSSLVVDGIIQGVGTVLAFLPNIIILFFFLSILEDSGYLARAAFLMDKLMHRIGLHGRSFVPMLIGFGCNVPAIMAARSIEDRRDRTLTMLMIPYMSCSARLPVYMLFVSAFFARSRALVMIGIYLTGVLLSILFAFIMKRTKFFRKSDDDFVSELPPFRMPTFRNTGMHIWERCADYLRKISTVILAASVVIWALEYFPAGKTDGGINKEESYLAMVGKAMEPVMQPLGFDWKMDVCLLTGLPAKEAIVSTMGILYHSEDEGSIIENMCADRNVTAATALAFMIFVLLYFPCLATIATLKREAGRKWAAFSVVHSLILAWVMAFIIFQIGSLLL